VQAGSGTVLIKSHAHDQYATTLTWEN